MPTVVQLRKMCKESGIKGYSKWPKSTLIRALQEKGHEFEEESGDEVPWLNKRSNAKYKNKIEILEKPLLLKLYHDYRVPVLNFLDAEQELGLCIGRIPNFPSEISENIVLYVLRLLKRNCSWACKGDIIMTESGENGSVRRRGEVKCAFNGPSQFSPKNKKMNDTLFFVDASQHLKETAHFKVYEIPKYMESLKKVKISKTQSVEEQQVGGRRPRFSIKDTWEDLEDKKIWEGSIYDLLK